jgi:predicted HTH transcriptional regulator
MADKKFTNRDGFNAVINGKVDDEVRAWAMTELAKLDAKNDKRRNTKTKEQIANEGIMNSIVEHIKANGSVVASELGTALGISTQKASALCKILVDGGELTVADKKIKGKGSVKEYSLATPTDTTDEVVDEVAED